jgi:hypothetical protein
MPSMSHPLERRLVALRRRVRRRETIYALCLTTASLLAAIVALGTIDYLLQLHDRGLRIIASLAALAVFGVMAYRLLASSLLSPIRDVDLALSAERFFPNLHNRLASAVEFLQQSEDDPTAGSPALRRAVIAQATAETQDADLSTVLDPRPTIRAAAVLAAACLLSGVIVALAPSVSSTALLRLLNPFGNATWPQATHLVILSPVERIARGQNFHVEVADLYGARLPQQVFIHYRLQSPDGGTVAETEPMRPADARMVADRENVVRPFSYRVDGGDDRSMPWLNVDVVDPPAIESISIRLIPPAHTGKPPTTSGRHIRALVGTRVQIVGKATKPLTSASLCLEDGRTIPAQLTDDALGFSVGAVVDKSGTYWLDLTDAEGLTGGSDDRWQIVAVPDVPPTVHIERPAADLFVTPQAVVPVRVSAKDDLALRSIALAFRLTESSPESSISLFAGPPQPPRQTDATSDGDTRIVDYRWSLAPLNLQPGMKLPFFATADDYLPQTVKSAPRRLIVVTPDDLQDRIADREGLVVAELDRALKMQRRCREQVESLQTRLSPLLRLERSDVDQLQAAEHSQRDVNQVIAGRGEGVPQHCRAILADLDNNGIDNADLRRRIASLLEELDRLDRDVIPPLSRELTSAVKTAQVDGEGQGGGDRPNSPANENRTVPLSSASPVRSVVDSLAAAAHRQDSIVASIERQIARFARWDGYRRLHRELGQLIRDQHDAARRTSDVGRRTLARDLRDLSPQDAADLNLAATQQFDLARLLDRLLQEADQAIAELRKTDPLAADTVADALDQARRLAISGQMRAAAGQIQQNQIGQATAAQKQILQDLREVLDVLARQTQNELVRLVKKLKEVETDLAALEQQQDDIRGQIAAAAKDAKQDAKTRRLQQLARQQQQLREQTERLSRELASLQADGAAQAAALAARQMTHAADRAGQGDGAAAARSADDARRHLADACRQLADKLRQSSARLATEQVARLEDTVKHLHRQQQNALDEARRLDGLEQSQGQLTRSQALSLRDLARLQRSLQTDAVELAQRLSSAAVLELAMTRAARDMARAADLLDRRQTGPSTQDAQRLAVRQLGLLVEVFKPEPPSAQDQSPSAGDNPPRQGPPAAVLPPLAELKLMRLMQQELNSRIEDLDKAAAGKPTPEQSRQYIDLSDQQGRLADIVLQSLQPANQDDELKKTPPHVKPIHLRLVDEEQLKRELGAAAVKEDDNPLQQIASQMREAQQRIARSDSGPDTQQLQRQIVADLDRLIQRARQTAGQCSSDTSQSQPSSRTTPSDRSCDKPGQPGSQPPTGKPPSGTSPPSAASPTARKPNAAQTQALIKRLWGALPERQRELMLQSPPEEFPPDYELLIEDYFRRLSEKER